MNITLSTDDKRINLTQSEQSIRLAQENNDVNLSQNTTDITLAQLTGNGLTLETDENRITFTQPNLRGLQGERGVGVPEGGQEGEVLIKGAGDSTEWGAFEGADKNYTTTFTNQSVIIVTHNLNKYPAVTVINSANDEVIGNVEYLGVNSLIVSFNGSFSGRLTCN